MAASASDYFMKTGKSTATTLSSPGYTVGNTSINVGSTSELPTDTGIFVMIDEVDANAERVAGTYNVFRGTVSSGTQVNNLVYVGGDTNRDYSAGTGTRVYMTVSSYHTNRMIEGLLISHDQDGTLKAGAVDNTAVITDAIITEAKHANGYLHGSDGYIDATDTWTYASSTTFTIAGVDRTAMFPVGTKIRLTQTTDKYFYVTGSSFSTNTTVTVTGGSDYSLANATITSPRYSYMATPQGFPTWMNYSPSNSNITVGNGTQYAKFSMVGKTVHVKYKLTGGTTTSFGGQIGIGLPVTGEGNTNVAGGHAYLEDAGVFGYESAVRYASTTQVAIIAFNTAGTYASAQPVTNTLPYNTFGNGDFLGFIFTYEAA